MSKTRTSGPPALLGRKRDDAGRQVVPVPEAKQGLKAPRPFTGYELEQATYARVKPALLEAAPGRFVALVGDRVLGPFETLRDAYLAGRRRFGPGPLYIKQVLVEEPAFEPLPLEICPS